MNNKDASFGCRDGLMLIMAIARQADKLLKLKRAAIVNKADVIYACPDLSKHGDAYAMTAMPFKPDAIQGELF